MELSIVDLLRIGFSVLGLYYCILILKKLSKFCGDKGPVKKQQKQDPWEIK